MGARFGAIEGGAGEKMLNAEVAQTAQHAEEYNFKLNIFG
jgi:hypothetical protein